MNYGLLMFYELKIMKDINKYGLSRYINESTKEIIRKRDGFGCVHCGLGLYTYEHFNPEFKNARFHDINGITLLCGQCQYRTTKGFLSKETIQNDVLDPFCKKRGYTNDFFDLVFPFLVYFGNFEYYVSRDKDDHPIIIVNNEVILGCSKDSIGGPMQLTAVFRDTNNNISLEIIKNEWRASTKNWDIKQVGKKLSVYYSQKKIGIEIEVSPPQKIFFNNFITYYNGYKLMIDRQKIAIQKANGEENVISTSYLIRRAAPIEISL